MKSESDALPISKDTNRTLRSLILRAITKNQILLLQEIEKNFTKTVTALITKISKSNKIPISTLKSNSQILRELGLIEFEISQPVELTEAGKRILEIIGDEL